MAPGVGAQTQADILAGNASGGISTDRINDACRRILRALFRKGMFENYHALAGYNSYFHSDLHKQVARQCVAASMVVLKNESSTLPLKKGNQKIAVIGMWGNDVGLQCGGWTLGWQGAPGAQKPAGTTMYMSLQQQGGGNTVTYSADGSTIPSDANVVVVCVGMNPAAEYTKSDNQLQLLDSQYGKISDLMGKASASGKPIVLALFVDAPVVVTQYITQAKAVVCAWLGSPEGGGFGDILYGDVHPTGKLNHTWPSTISQIPINDGNMGDATGSGGTPLYPLGYGLTY
jgi:beta-glucosidase